MSDRTSATALPDPFGKNNYDRLLPDEVVEKAELKDGDDLEPDFNRDEYRMAKDDLVTRRESKQVRASPNVEQAENEKSILAVSFVSMKTRQKQQLKTI